MGAAAAGGMPAVDVRSDSCAKTVRVYRRARGRDVEVRFAASEGPGSHGTLYAGERKTAVKDRRKEIGPGLLNKMLADLGIDRNEL